MFNYTTLKAAIKAHCEDSGTNFDTHVDTIIQLGEQRLLKDLPIGIVDTTGNVSITAGSQVATKVSGTIATRELFYTSGGTRVVLLPRTHSFCLEFCKNTTQAAPKYFAEDYSETEYFLSPNPNVTVTASAKVTKRPASIVTATTTFFGTNVGDLLLAACMIAGERFNLGWEEGKNWETEYNTLLKAARNDFRHLIRRDYATLAPQPAAVGKGER